MVVKDIIIIVIIIIVLLEEHMFSVIKVSVFNEFY